MSNKENTSEDDFDGFPDHLKEVIEFRVSLNFETDRGCALMVASLLDAKLEKLLLAKFVDDTKTADELLSQSGPLATFSSRIDASYLIGLVGPQTRRDLHLIRKIRNEFGHSHRSLTFKTEAIQSRCKELFHFHAIETTDEPRKIFVKTSISLLALLNADLRKTQHLPIGKDLYLDGAEREKHKANIKQLAKKMKTDLVDIFEIFKESNQK